MPVITLLNYIKAPVDVCFDLSRNIDLHKESMSESAEVAVAGVTSGLINKDETVTWKARHFGVFLKMQVRISSFKSNTYFCDEQVTGPFRSLKHHHHFEQVGNATLMQDKFEFEAAPGFIGWLVEKLFLRTYLKKLLIARNKFLKRIAERETTSVFSEISPMLVPA